MELKKISIILPVYNEEFTVEFIASELLKNYGDSEIIIVDDGSSDGTLAKLKNINVKVIKRRINKGYGAALKTGINYSSGEYVLIFDVDGEYSINDIELLIPEAEEFDMITGARLKNANLFPFYQRIVKWIVCLLLSLIFKKDIPDINSGLRIFKKAVLYKYLYLLPDGFSFTSSITLAMLLDNRNIKYIPIDYANRIVGKSKIRVLRYTIDFIKSYVRIIYYLRFAQKNVK